MKQGLRKYLVKLLHQINRGLIKANWRVIDRGTADLEQLALPSQAQLSVLFEDHFSAFRRAHHFNPCDKKSFPTTN